MGWLLSILLLAALLVSQILHGGLIFPALAWPTTLAVGGAAMLAGADFLRQRETLDWKSLSVPFLLLLVCGYAFWRWQTVATPWHGLHSINNLITGLLACCAVVFGLRSPRQRLFFAAGLAGVALLLLLQMFAFRFAGGGLEFPWFSEQLRIWYENRFHPAASAVFMNRNQLSWVLNAGCLLAAAICVWARIPAYLKFLAGWICAIFVIGILLTFSRGGVVGLLAGWGVFLAVSMFFLLTSRVRFRIALTVLGCVLLAGAGGTAAWLITSDYQVKMRIEAITDDPFREGLWPSGIRQFESEPLLGTGPGTSAAYSRILRPPRTGPSEPVYLHNDWLQLLAEGGWIGFSLIALTLLAAFYCAWYEIFHRGRLRLRDHVPQSNQLAVTIGGLSCLGAFAAHSFFDFNLHLAANSLLAFLILGLVVTPVEKSPDSSNPRFSFVNGILGIAICALAFAWIHTSTPWFSEQFRAMKMENERIRGGLSLAKTRATEPVGHPTASLPAHMAIGEVWLAAQSIEEDEEERNRQRTRAAWHFLRAANAEPLEGFSRMRLATLLSLRGQHSQAWVSALEAVHRDPFNAMPYEYLAGVCEAAGDFAQAARWYGVAAQQPGFSVFGRWRAQTLREAREQGTIPRPTIPGIPEPLRPDPIPEPAPN